LRFLSIEGMRMAASPEAARNDRMIAALAAFFFLLWSVSVEAAQFGKYSVTGAVEAEYKDEKEKTGDSTNDYNAFMHRYKIGVQSFILSPKLLTYDLGLTLEKGNGELNGNSSGIDNLGYNARTELFSGRRINGSLYSRRESSSTFVPMTSGVGSSLVSQTNTTYGANSNLNFKVLPMALSYDENQTTGTSGTQQIDRTVRRTQLSANKNFYGFSGKYGYDYTNTKDSIEAANNTEEHVGTVNLEKKFSDKLAFREDLRFTSASRLGSFQDIISTTVTKTANYTLTSADEIVRFDATIGELTAQLPTALGNAGRTFTIVKIDATINRITVRPAGTETINGASFLILQTQWSEVTVVSNGVNWTVGSRTARREGVGVSNINLNSMSNLSYRPSAEFSNDSALNLYYYKFGEDAGTNVSVTNGSNYQVNPELAVTSTLGGNYSEAGKTKTATENGALSFNYRKKLDVWNIGLFETTSLNVVNQSDSPGKVTSNIGAGASAGREYDWLKSNLAFQTQGTRSSSSGGGGTTGGQVSGSWGASPTEALQVQSNLRYSIDNTRNDAVVVTSQSGETPTVQSYSNDSSTIGLDVNYSWLAFASENKTASLSGGALLSQQKSVAGEGRGGSTTDRNFYYSQLVFRMAPLRSMTVSMNLRGEWDRSTTDLGEMMPGSLPRTVTQRTAYVMENQIHFRVRRILFELKHEWRDETGTNVPYSRQSIFIKASRPF
jgi:hypothetical protein